MGGALGLAVLVTVAAARSHSHAGPVPEALTAGYDLGFVIAGVLFLLVVLIATIILPRKPSVATMAVSEPIVPARRPAPEGR